MHDLLSMAQADVAMAMMFLCLRQALPGGSSCTSYNLHAHVDAMGVDIEFRCYKRVPTKPSFATFSVRKTRANLAENRDMLVLCAPSILRRCYRIRVAHREALRRSSLSLGVIFTLRHCARWLLMNARAG